MLKGLIEAIVILETTNEVLLAIMTEAIRNSDCLTVSSLESAGTGITGLFFFHLLSEVNIPNQS